MIKLKCFVYTITVSIFIYEQITFLNVLFINPSIITKSKNTSLFILLSTSQVWWMNCDKPWLPRRHRQYQKNTVHNRRFDWMSEVDTLKFTKGRVLSPKMSVSMNWINVMLCQCYVDQLLEDLWIIQRIYMVRCFPHPTLWRTGIPVGFKDVSERWQPLGILIQSLHKGGFHVEPSNAFHRWMDYWLQFFVDHYFRREFTNPYAPCMEYLPACTININQIQM